MRVDAFDTVHGQTGEQHGRGALGGVQAVNPAGIFREGLDFLCGAVFDDEAAVFGSADRLHAVPGQGCPVRERDAGQVEGSLAAGEAQVWGKVHAGMPGLAGLQGRAKGVGGQDDLQRIKYIASDLNTPPFKNRVFKKKPDFITN